MIHEHFDAVKAQLDASDVLDVHDSLRTDADGNPVRASYQILFGGLPDQLGSNRLNNEQFVDDDAVFIYTVRSISTTADGARAGSVHAFGQLVGFVPTLAGRRCSKIKHRRSEPVAPDHSLKPPLFFCDDDYELRTYRT